MMNSMTNSFGNLFRYGNKPKSPKSEARTRRRQEATSFRTTHSVEEVMQAVAPHYYRELDAQNWSMGLDNPYACIDPVGDIDFSEDRGVSDNLPTEFELGIEVTNRSTSWGNNRQYCYKNNIETLISLSEISFPGCCGACILKGISIDRGMAQKDFNTFMNALVDDLKDNDSFARILIYTTTNEASHGFLSNYPNTTILDTFKNPRTGRILTGFEIVI